jgi:hypothetical protein
MLAGAGFVFAQSAGMTVKTPVRHDVSPELFSLALAAPVSPVVSPPREMRKHGPLIDELINVGGATYTAWPSVAATQSSTAGVPRFSATPGVNFEGLGSGFPGYSVAGAPPDTTMAVGPSHVVQWVNVHFAVFDKTGATLLPAPGFSAGNTIWAGFGGVCQTTNRGDVLVQYDHLADRWIFSQFAFNLDVFGNPAAPFVQCFAVSTTNNPMGAFNRYEYSFTEFNDYGKLGVWPDAYYMSYNMFNAITFANTGAQACAYDRAAMIAGAPGALSICTTTNFFAGGASLLPSDWDGTAAPPAGAPNIFMRQSTAPALRLLKFHVDFVTPANSTFNDGFGGAFGSFIALPIPGTVRACNGTGAACIPQPGTTQQLDTLSDRIMYRLAYRNRGGVDTLVNTQSIDPDGAGPIQAALRVYEIRNAFAAAPTLFQNFNYVPDSTNRWMGSVAMDKAGNMAIGYSVSDSTTNPGIRITGRLRSELRNRMQIESVIVNGSGSQVTPLDRWGDYSAMQVDPTDDCTFWYTTEYIGANGTFNWRTRIANFKFPGCQ